MKIKNIPLDKLISDTTNRCMIKMFGNKKISKNNDMDIVTLKCFNLSKEEIHFSFTFFNFHKKELAINILISLFVDNEWCLYQPINNLRSLSGEETVKVINLYKTYFLNFISNIENSNNIENFLIDNHLDIVS